MSWILLIISLPTENATARMRSYRALKSCGAAVLRDGVYLMPARDEQVKALEAIAQDLRQHGGMARLMRIEPMDSEDFSLLFDRGQDHGELLKAVAACRASLSGSEPSGSLKQVRKIRRQFEHLLSIDFFPGEAQRQAAAALQSLELDLHRQIQPDEPMPADVSITRRRIEDYQGKLWATRRRPWVDRLASAWLIRRFIDPQARFQWLHSVADCPKKALGFDFDGATFSHVGARVTFETLLASFGLETPALLRLGVLVHSLDVGGVQPAEAQGVERVLSGMREAIEDDDLLAQMAAGVFEGLWIAFTKEGQV